MSDIAIRVENLSKYYRLGVINSGTFSRDLQSWIYKRLGKEDPNKRIGYKESDADGFWALKDLNFEIKKGDRVGIIGHNGAGKSTLLKMLSQISSPTTGKIYIDGKIASLLEVGTGFNPELTGRENIYLNGAILGMKKKEVDRKIDEIIAFSEIERHIDTPVKRYSSGMYVRLAFAVAAHLDSDILIADEVLAVGDAAFQKKALGKMNELSTSEGRTVLFVSHQVNAVRNLCNKGIYLKNGLIECNSTIDTCIDYYMNNSINLESKNNYTWRKTNAEIFHDGFVPLLLCITNSETIYRDKYISVKVVFEVKEVDTDLYWGICLRDKNDYPLFLTGPREEIKDYMSKIGINSWTCNVPIDLLNTGTFKINLEASSKSHGWYCEPNSNSPFLFFSIKRDSFHNYDTGTFILPYVDWRMSGNE